MERIDVTGEYAATTSNEERPKEKETNHHIFKSLYDNIKIE